MIKRSAGLQICTYTVKLHGVFSKSPAVKRIELIGQRVIAEFLSIQIPGPQKRPPAGISPVPAESQIIADRPSMLTGFEITAEHCSRRNAGDGADLSVYSFFHHYIQNAGRKQAPHGTAFEYQSCTFIHNQFPPPVLRRNPVFS